MQISPRGPQILTKIYTFLGLSLSPQSTLTGTKTGIKTKRLNFDMYQEHQYLWFLGHLIENLYNYHILQF